MGVALSNIIESSNISIEELFDKKIAVDALNWIYQFLSIIRQKDGEALQDSKGRVTSHLSGLFYRNIKLIESGIRPLYVFDGKPTEMKKETNQKRRDIREEAKREWKEALSKGDYEEAKKYAQRSVTITDEILDDSKKLLDALGIQVIQAKTEGEALCSVMAKNNDVYAVATQDYDSLLFGAPRLIRNLSITGKRKRGDSFIEIHPEIFILKDILDKLEIDHDQLILLGILVGTDFNPGGVAGFGPKKALELVKEKKTIKHVFEEIEWGFDAEPEKIFSLFKHPDAGHYNIEFKELDKEKVKKILVDEHDFSEERIDNGLKRLETKADQKSLNRWFR